VTEPTKTGEEPNLESQIEEHLRSVKNPQERRTIAELFRVVSNLPLEHMRAAIETSGTVAVVSLRASIEFLRATPEAARVLEPAELRAWGELGRRLTTNDVESGISFFTTGIAGFARVPGPVRPFVFQVCSRQMILSAGIAAETFREAPALADAVSDAEVLRSIYEIAANISRRSAKHSAEFLSATPAVVEGVGHGVLGVEVQSPTSNVHQTDIGHRTLDTGRTKPTPNTRHPTPSSDCRSRSRQGVCRTRRRHRC
jgi:hypothetical protein